MLLARLKLIQVFRGVFCVSGVELLDSIGNFDYLSLRLLICLLELLVWFRDLSSTLLCSHLLNNFRAKHIFKTCRVFENALLSIVGYRCDELNLMLPIAIGTV